MRITIKQKVGSCQVLERHDAKGNCRAGFGRGQIKVYRRGEAWWGAVGRGRPMRGQAGRAFRGAATTLISSDSRLAPDHLSPCKFIQAMPAALLVAPPPPRFSPPARTSHPTRPSAQGSAITAKYVREIHAISYTEGWTLHIGFWLL